MPNLYNPFMPSEIAANPDDFFGRSEELNNVCMSLPQGSVAIQGVVGIGKSSLLSRSLLQMEGFDSEHSAKSSVCVGDKDVKTVDEAARLVLESFIQVDEKHKKIAFKIGSLFESESIDICRNFVEGRHLAVLKRVVESEFLNNLLGNTKFLLLGIDEADKCPIPLASGVTQNRPMRVT
jgi:ABC-type phosphate transport system ATPase subunit